MKLAHLNLRGLTASRQVSPDVRRMGTAEFISGLGSTAANLALFFVAFSNRGSAKDAAYVSAAYSIFYMLGTFGSRAVERRVDHRRVVLLQVVLKIIVYALPWVLALMGTLSLVSILVTMALAGVVTSLTEPSYYEVLQDLSPEGGVAVANAFIGARYSAAAVIGALVGGVALAAVGPTWLLFANLISYLPLVWLYLRLPDTASGGTRGDVRPRLVTAIADLFRTRLLRLGILLDLAIVALSIPAALLTKLANGVGASATYYGIVSAASGLGMVLTLSFLTRLSARRTRPTVVIASIVALGLGVLLTGAVGASGVRGIPGVVLLSITVCLAFLGSYAAGDKLLAVVQVGSLAKERTVAIAAITFVAMGAATAMTLVEGALADVVPVWWIQLVAGTLALLLSIIGAIAARRGWLPAAHTATG